MLIHAADPSTEPTSPEPAASSSAPGAIAALGPLQLRIMHLMWRVGGMTVYDVSAALNGEPGAVRLAYTTYLTVMRNLVKRGILQQERIANTKAHRFSPKIGEDAYKRDFLRLICKEYCGSDAQRFLDYVHTDPRDGSAG